MKKKPVKEISHWNCGDLPDIESVISEFVDDNVYKALEEYGRDISMLVTAPDWDNVCLYLAEGRPVDGQGTNISTTVSLREELLAFAADSVFHDGAVHPEDCRHAIKLAEHLESIAKEIRERVDKANLVAADHKWS